MTPDDPYRAVILTELAAAAERLAYWRAALAALDAPVLRDLAAEVAMIRAAFLPPEAPP